MQHQNSHDSLSGKLQENSSSVGTDTLPDSVLGLDLIFTLN